jgi:hypothetical protein
LKDKAAHLRPWHSFVVIDFVNNRAAVHIHDELADQVVDEPKHVDRYRAIHEELLTAALSTAAWRRFLIDLSDA